MEEVTELKKIPVEFDKFGYHFEQVERTETKAIYVQTYAGRTLAFEIVRIRIRQGGFNTLFNKQEPTREVYPGSEEWGERGWTVCDKDEAQKKYHSLK